MRDALSLVAVFLRRDLAIARSYRFPFWIQLITSAGILLVINRVSKLVDPSQSSDPALRAGFFSYVLVGMAVLQFVNSALVAFTSKLREEQVTGTFAALLTTPASPAGLALSLAAFEILQGIVSSLVLLAVGALAGANFTITVLSLCSAVLVVLGMVAVAGAVGVALAAFTVVFKRGNAVAGLGSAVVVLFAGVYFPVRELPASVRWAAEAIPFTHGITALRASLLLGEVDVAGLLVVWGSAVVLVPSALVVFGRAVDRARRQGSLEQY